MNTICTPAICKWRAWDMLNSGNVLRTLLRDSLEPAATPPPPPPALTQDNARTATAWTSTGTLRKSSTHMERSWRLMTPHSMGPWPALETLLRPVQGAQSDGQWRTGPRLLHYRYSSPVDGRRINKGAIYELSEWNSYDSVNNRIIWITGIVGILVLKLSLSFLIQEIRLGKDVESGIYSWNNPLYSYYKLWWASVQNVQNQAGRKICSE